MANLAKLLAAAAALALTLRCGEPLGPEAPKWVSIAAVPAEYGAQGIANYYRGVLLAGSHYEERLVGHGVILSYRSGAFDVEFMSPNQTGEVIFYDIDAGGDYAVGTYTTSEGPTKCTPYMVARDPSRSEWNEVQLKGAEGERITQVLLTGRACWLLIGTTGPRGGRLFKYKGEGVVEKQEGLPYFGSVAASREENIIFGASYVAHGRYKAVVSFDGGATWHEEEIAFDAPGTETMFVDAGCVSGRDLYFYVKFEGWAGGGIVKRTGPPGEGLYELAFLGPRLGFKDAASDADGRVAAVGPGTSVLYDGEDWRIEELPYPLVLRQVLPASGGGFFALGENKAVRRREILYHR